MALAEDIKRQADAGRLGKKTATTVFVRTFDDEDAYSSNASFGRVFSMVKLKNREIGCLRHLHCHVTTSFHRLSGQANIESGTPVLRHRLGLGALDRLIRHATGDVHLLILSEDEDMNISCTDTLQKDSAVMHAMADGRTVHLYCHARHSAKTRGLEIKDICSYGSHLRIHVIDSSRLSVSMLKNHVEYHPVNFVGIDKSTATVTTPFRAAIVGFGETGQEAFRFLYEFGAFVTPGGGKAPFHCTIIDEKAGRLKGLFMAKAPSLPASEYSFHSHPIDSPMYWRILEKEVRNGLSNIFITLSDEELAIGAAVNFCNLAVRWITDNNRPINVYIRSYRHENIERLEAIRDELNGKYAAINIVIFGNVHNLFTYDIIINDRYIREAKMYNYAYSTGTVVSVSTKEAEMEEKWHKELKCSRTKASPTIWNVEDTERRRDQNISNALHAATKMHILEQSGKPSEYWKTKNLERSANTPHYLYINEDDENILLNIAKLEHERWMAASRLQGQTLAESHCKDDQHKRHTDLVPWNDIRKWDTDERLEVQSYDCLVVDTTIKLSNNITTSKTDRHYD